MASAAAGGRRDEDSAFFRAIDSFINYLKHGIKAMLRPLRDFLKWLFERLGNHTYSNGGLTGFSAVPWRLILWGSRCGRSHHGLVALPQFSAQKVPSGHHARDGSREVSRPRGRRCERR